MAGKNFANVAIIPGTKLCPNCKVVKDHSQFSVRGARHGGTKRAGQLVGYCKSCMSERLKQRKARDPSVYRRIEWPSKLKRLYGLTVEGYFKILQNQGGVCAICSVDNPCKQRSRRDGASQVFFVDHCHKTGIVRGLLCNNCNQAIGFLRDSSANADRLAAYLRRSSWPTRPQ